MWDNFALPAFALRKTPVKKLASLAAAFAASLLLSACGGNNGSSAGPPSDFAIQVGDSSVTATWTAEPDVSYWIFYGPGSNITTTNWVASGGKVLTNVTSPTIITGLVNGTTYSFTINGRKSGGPRGEGAPPPGGGARPPGDHRAASRGPTGRWARRSGRAGSTAWRAGRCSRATRRSRSAKAA